MSNKFYGWIPTNKGKLEIIFIGRPDFMTSYVISDFYAEDITITDKPIYEAKVNLDFMNDASLLNTYRKKPSEYSETIATLTIYKNFSGKINYLNINGTIDVSFNIEDNGRAEFYDYEQDDTFDKNTIQQSMFILVKLFVHRDNHHHQKIDTALRVYDSFDKFKIANDILVHIKILENSAKRNNRCESQLKNYNALEEAKGYMAYLKTFNILFENDNYLKNTLKKAKNVISSMKSNIKKRKNKDIYIRGLYSAIFTFIGLFLSINLWINGLYGKVELTMIDRIDVMVFTFLGILLLFYTYTRCKLRTIIHYKFYEIFDILSFIKYSNLSDLSIKGKIIKLIPALIGISVFIWYATNYSNN